MGDRPIIFSAPMVRALLDGRKSQTRRIIKDRGALPEFCGGRGDDKNDPQAWGWEDHDRGEWITLDQWRRYRFVPYRPGDRLWVREAWRTPESLDHLSGREIGKRCLDAGYRGAWGPRLTIADDMTHQWSEEDGFSDSEPAGRYRHALFMPRWASRLTLVVTDVRVQRVQDISRNDCIAEGGPPSHPSIDRVSHEFGYVDFSRSWFAQTWNTLHGPDAWDRNDWVAALTFKVHRCNIDEMEAKAE